MVVKIIFCLLIVFALPAHGAKKMTPEEQNVSPISETNNCEFIKTAYFEVSHPSKLHYYAAKNTVHAGGDSYKILYGGEEDALFMTITKTNIAIYKCKSPLVRENSFPPKELDDEESEVLSYIDELKTLAKLRDDGILTEEEFKQQKAKILARENAPPKTNHAKPSYVPEIGNKETAIQSIKTSESLLGQLQSSSQETRTSASMKVFNEGIGNERVYEEVAIAIRIQLPTLNKKSPRAQQQEVAWHIKVLSCSGNQEYLPLLDELSGSPAKKVAKYAKKYKKILAESAPCR